MAWGSETWGEEVAATSLSPLPAPGALLGGERPPFPRGCSCLTWCLLPPAFPQCWGHRQDAAAQPLCCTAPCAVTLAMSNQSPQHEARLLPRPQPGQTVSPRADGTGLGTREGMEVARPTLRRRARQSQKRELLHPGFPRHLLPRTVSGAAINAGLIQVFTPLCPKKIFLRRSPSHFFPGSFQLPLCLITPASLCSLPINTNPIIFPLFCVFAP